MNTILRQKRHTKWEAWKWEHHGDAIQTTGLTGFIEFEEQWDSKCTKTVLI